MGAASATLISAVVAARPNATPDIARTFPVRAVF